MQAPLPSSVTVNKNVIDTTVHYKRVFCGEMKFRRDYSSTAAAVPLPSQGKVKIATDSLFCIIIILMISNFESIEFTDY